MWSNPLWLVYPFFLSLSLKRPQDLTLSFRQIYDRLSLPGHVSYQPSPTLRFDKVSNDTWEKQKPLAVYLPGLDGYGVSAASFQFNDLSHTFDLWRLFMYPDDRSSFQDVTQTISNFVVELQRNTSKPVVLIGESCGGLLATATAIQLRETSSLRGLVLVNPATSFDDSAWDLIVPQLTLLDELTNGAPSSHLAEAQNDSFAGTLDHLPSPYSLIGSLVLSAAVPDNDQLSRILNNILSVPGSPQDFLEAALVAFHETGNRLPAQLLQHRINWLLVGAPIVNTRISLLDLPTLIIVGRQDKLLPSDSEANRLANLMPNAEKLVVNNRGHFVLDENINLTEAILFSGIDPLSWRSSKPKYDPIMDWTLPDSITLGKALENRVKPFKSAHSPVWFSTDKHGRRWSGLSKVPHPANHDGSNEGPLLVVGNHQLAGLDLGLVLSELWEKCGFWPRGLAHPVTFFESQGKPGELNGRTAGILDGDDPRPSFQRFGAVLVTPRNYYRLMESRQHTLLFPGGAKEAQSGRKDYPLFWPDKVDFVRTAAKFNATIIPLSAIGMVDSVSVIAEPDQIAKMPFLGDRLRSFNANISSARYDERNSDEIIGFPILVPRLPARNYFLFGKPISLKEVDPNDREACSQVYHNVKNEVRRGLDDLLEARKHDEYRETPKRLLYERIWGKLAPTFDVEKLNTS